jgi:putative heme-binding domain-containing protein
VSSELDAPSTQLESLRTLQEAALEELLDDARHVAVGEDALLSQRLEAVELLSLGSYSRERDALESLLSRRQAPEIRAAVLEALARFNHEDVPKLILSRWPEFSPAERIQAADILLRREGWTIQWLEHLKVHGAALTSLEPGQLARLTNFPSVVVRDLARELQGPSIATERRQVFDEYRQTAIAGGVNPAAGKAVFEKNCATCHALDSTDDTVGPNLLQMAKRGRESLLFNILVPNGEVDPRFLEYIVLTVDGEVVSGAIIGETSTAVTIRTAENKSKTILRVDIDELQNTGKSLMPEGFEKVIDQRAMADLLDYLEHAAAGGTHHD